ncbi:tyrosine-type recombinase/integrase [Halorubrum vacuolatum]|uniref:Phage integrase family protein n=1 Tax=Halorubrum vacuolatum TaxID=63740 RepID=A0A238YJS4_HALVU|nr:site-specific integrase [Halorubrum vacuolatum]SNR71367.1 Phage integrase family protein [Halorubrum vacuolatum]
MTETESAIEITEELRGMLGDDALAVQKQYEAFYQWMITEGKNPRRAQALGESTAGNYLDRIDQLHRFVLTYLDPDDPTVITDDHADELLWLIDRAEITQQNRSNKGEEYGENSKRKFANALQKYFQWQYHEGSMEYVWESKIDFSDVQGESAYRFTYRELGLLFDESASHGSLPAYYETSIEEREKINGIVAQRLGIPKDEVTRSDWQQADWSRHVHSLVTVAYDAGLAPIEVANAEVPWYDPQTKTLTIPTEYACKERDKERVGLSDEAAEALSEWLQERRHREKYDGSNKIWLNRNGNPYQSGSLCNLIRKLCEKAGVKTEGRKVVWYSLRQTMGRNVTDEGELSEANDQLRHSRLATTQENYNQTPTEKLRARLNETRRKARRSAEDHEYNPYEESTRSNDSQVTSSSSQPVSVSNRFGGAVSQATQPSIHIDVEIPDTTEARVDIAKEILGDDPTEQGRSFNPSD